jgi:lysophospholipase L1-like esterase
MRKTLITIILAMSAFMAYAQPQIGDWAKFNRYHDANKEVTTSPRVVFMGDSITDFWVDADPDFFTENNFLGRGISGQTTSHMLVRFRRDVIDHHPKYVVILAGTNDVAKNLGEIAPENSLGNIISMCEIARANKIKPIICSILPCNFFFWRPEVKGQEKEIIELNALLKEYAESAKIPYVDYHSAMKDDKDGLPKKYADDGCHPNKTGYEVMKEIILKYL